MESKPSENMLKWTEPFKSPFIIDLTGFSIESFWLEVEFAALNDSISIIEESVLLSSRKQYKFTDRVFVTFRLGNRTILKENEPTGSIAIITSVPVEDFTKFSLPDRRDLIRKFTIQQRCGAKYIYSSSGSVASVHYYLGCYADVIIFCC